MRVYSSCVLRYHISNMLERAPNICPAEMYAYQSTIQRNICIHMLDCPADMYAYDGGRANRIFDILQFTE